MLGAMLGSTDGAICTPESQFVKDLVKMIKTGRHLTRYDLTMYLMRHWRFRLWGIRSLPPEDWIRDPKRVDTQDVRELITWVVLAYASTNSVVRNSPGQVMVWVDHTPSNLRFAKSLMTVFPESKFIHVVRDGRAVAASILPLDWGPNTVLSAARWWIMEVAQGLAAEAYFGPDRVLRVRYEDLVNAPEWTLERLCQFAGVNFRHNAVTGTEFVVPEYTKRQHHLVGKPPERQRVDAWRSQLTPREIEVFESIAGEMLEFLGYGLMYKGAAKPPHIYESVLFWIKEECRTGINKFAHVMRRHIALRKLSVGKLAVNTT